MFNLVIVLYIIIFIISNLIFLNKYQGLNYIKYIKIFIKKFKKAEEQKVNIDLHPNCRNEM